MLRKYIHNSPLIILFLILCILPFFYKDAAGGRIWDGYYLIGVPEGEAESVLGSGWFSRLETVSSLNTSLTFNDYGEMKTVELEDLDERFIEGDPRVDEFMLAAGDYFRTETEDGRKIDLIYVKSSLSAIRFYFHTRSSYGKAARGWLFPDINIMYRLGAVLLFAVCWIFGIIMLKGLRILAFAPGAAWLSAIILCSPDILAAASVNYLIFVLAVKEIYPDLIFYLNYREIRFNRSSVVFTVSAAGAVIVSVISHIVQRIPLLPLLSSLAAEAVIIFVFYSLKSERARRQEHRLFFPVRLSSGRAQGDSPADGKFGRLPLYSAAAAAAVLIPLFAIFISETVEAPVPVPAAAASNASWEPDYLEYLDQSESGLPNAADFVKHEAFQECFMYDRPYEFPKRGDSWSVGHYVFENGEITNRQTCVLQFTDNWYFNIINPDNRKGLMKLILERDAPGGVYLRSEFSYVPAYSTKGHILICLSVFLPVLGRFLSNERITLRRKGQEA